MNRLDDLEAALTAAGCDPKRNRSNGGVCRCPNPNHPDNDPSASYSIGKDGDRQLIYCHSRGCTWEEIRVGIQDYLSVKPQPAYGRAVATTEPARQEYDYRDTDGRIVYQVVKTIDATGTKDFRQRHPNPDTGEWVWNLQGVTRLPYRLPELLQAIADGDTVYVVEGEKDVESMRRAGHTATCNSGGAGSFTPEIASWFAGAEVVIIADCDETGISHVHKVATVLDGVAASTLLCRPPGGIGTKRDISDHLAETGTLAGLVTLDGEPIDLTDPHRRPGDLPRTFWKGAPHLAHIRAEAERMSTNPTAVMGLVLTRVAAMVSHQYRTGRARGVPAGSLNYFTAVVGDPGAGKSTAEGVARSLLPRIGRNHQFADQVRPGSAAGLVSAFSYESKDDEGKREEKRRYNVNCWLDEGSHLFKIANRPSETIAGELASAWVGASLSTQLRSKADSRDLPGGTYALGFAMGLQPALAEPLFDTSDGGLCQRFLFVLARPPLRMGQFDPDDFDKDLEPVKALKWAPPPVVGARPDGDGQVIKPFTYPEVALRDLHRSREDPTWSYSDDPLDTHRLFTKCKTACLLAALDGRTSVTPDDWDRAEMVVAASAEVRSSIKAELDARAALEAERKRLAQIRTAVAMQRAVDDDYSDRARIRITGKLDEVGRDGATKTVLLKLFDSTRRELAEGVLGLMIGEGKVIEGDDGKFRLDHVAR